MNTCLGTYFFSLNRLVAEPPDGHLAVENDLPGDHICPVYVHVLD